MYSEKRNPRVSVVIPAFNVAHCIERAVKSVQAQSEQNFEIIIVDDASSDTTVDVVGRLIQEDPRICLCLSEKNGGPSMARNIGFQAAKGTWLAILDADDAFKPSRLKTLCDLAEKHNLDAIGDDILYFDEIAAVEVRPGKFVRADGLKPLSLDDYLETTTYRLGMREILYGEERLISLLKFVFRNEFIRSSAIRYSSKYRYCEDFLFYFDLLRAGAKAALYNEALYVYTEQLGSISRVRSPHSRTTADRSSIIAAVEDIFSKDTGLTANQKRLLSVRAQSVASFMRYETFRRELKSGHKFVFIQSLLRHPDILPYFLREVRRALVLKVSDRLPKGA